MELPPAEAPPFAVPASWTERRRIAASLAVRTRSHIEAPRDAYVSRVVVEMANTRVRGMICSLVIGSN